jgi:hypothetical protein
MSKELDAKIDATRDMLIETANTQIGYGNYKQQMRKYQEMFLAVINALDEVNQAIDKEMASKPEGDK